MSDLLFSPAGPAWRPVRSRFQRGLLLWLQGNDSAAALIEMQGAVSELVGSSVDNGGFWRTVRSLLQSLQDGTLPADDTARKLCGRLDRQLRQIEQGDASVPPDLFAATFDFVTRGLLGAAAPEATPAPAEDAATATTEEPAVAATTQPTATIIPIIPSMAGINVPGAGNDVVLDDAKVAAWEEAGRRVAGAWYERTGEDYAKFRSAVVHLTARALELTSSEPLRLAEALATVADLADEPEAMAEPALVAAVTATLEVLTERGAVTHPVFRYRVDHLAERLANCREVASRRAMGDTTVAGNGRLVVSRTLYQIFVIEARELLRRLYDELDTLHPQSGEMARTAMSLAESASTLQLGPLRELGMGLVHALAPRAVPLYVDDPEVRPLVRDLIVAIERMVDRLDGGGALGEEDEADAAMLAAALRQLADGPG